MSKKTFTDVLSNSEIQSNSISTLSNRPNDSIAYGGNGMSAAELKTRFDALTSKLIEKTNGRWELFNTAGDNGIAGYIPISSSSSLADLVASFDTGAFATVIIVNKPDNTTESLQARLNTLNADITAVDEALDNHVATYQPPTDTTNITLNADGELTLSASVLSSLTHADTCEANVQADWSDTDTASDSYIKNKPILGTAAAKDVGTAQGNVVELSTGGKLPTSVLPAIAICETLSAESDEAMLALTAQKGDVCIRPDETKTYILSAEPASVKANWKQLLFPNGGTIGGVSAVNGQTGVVVLSASDVGAASLSQLATKQDVLTTGSNITITDNTISVDTMAAPIADNTKPITSGGVFIALSSKVDSSSLKTVATSGSYNDLLNKPTIPTTVAGLTDGADYVKSADLAAVATSGSYADLTDKPTIPTDYYSEEEVDAKLALKANTASLADVATSGSYADLTGKPAIPTKTSDLTNDSSYVVSSELSSVATSGSYNDLTNKPTIPSAVTVDSAMSTSSTNPVQNKVIKAYVDANTGSVASVNSKTGSVVLSASDVGALPITGGTATGKIIVTATSAAGFESIRTVNNQDKRAGFFINSDGTSKFVNKNGEADIASLLFDDTGVYYAAGNNGSKTTGKLMATKEYVDNNIPEVPTKTSDLTNDSGYQTATQVQTAISTAIGTTSNLLGNTEDLS